MRGKILLTAALAALACVSLALAAPPAGKGKPASPGKSSGANASAGKGKPAGKGKATTGVGCKPAVAVILKGTLASAPGAGTSFTMNATSGNAKAKAYVAGAQPVTILITPTTKIRREGLKLATDLVVGDRVLVQSRVCKADLANGAVPPLTALKVIAHPVAAVTPPATTETTPTEGTETQA